MEIMATSDNEHYVIVMRGSLVLSSAYMLYSTPIPSMVPGPHLIMLGLSRVEIEQEYAQ